MMCFVFLNATGSNDMSMADFESDQMTLASPSSTARSTSTSRSHSRSCAVIMPPKYSASALLLLLSDTDFCILENQCTMQPW